MNIRNEVLDAMVFISYKGPSDPSYGICMNVHTILGKKIAAAQEGWPDNWEDQLDDYLEEVMSQWPKHSGNRAYPIADPRGFKHPNQYFWTTPHKWNGHQLHGQLRWELLQFCINWISTSPQG